MNQPDWYQVARNYLTQEKRSSSRNIPPTIVALIEWKGQTYVGGIQEVAPEYSKEIVLLSKSSHPIPKELKNAIAELDKDRLSLSAGTMLDLEGRLHVLRRVGDRLQQMTAGQMHYMERQPKTIVEENTGEIITASQPKRYISPEDMGPRSN